MRKLDTSMVFGLTYMYHSSISRNRKDGNVHLLKWMKNEHIIASHVDSSTSFTSGSSLSKEQDDFPLQITIGYRKEWSHTDDGIENIGDHQRQAVHAWLNPEYLSRSIHANLSSDDMMSS